jgi:hypothetical protein
VADPLLADAATAILSGLKGSFILLIFPGTQKNAFNIEILKHTLCKKERRKEKRREGESAKGKRVPSSSFREAIFRVHHSSVKPADTLLRVNK